jgi:hypothetical protein
MNEKQVPLKVYIKEKIRMLTKDFCLRLTDEEIKHLKSLKREIDVDHYAHALLTTKL